MEIASRLWEAAASLSVMPCMMWHMTHGSSAALRDLACQHLPSDVAERWVSLLRPAVRLDGASGSDVVVGQLGGLPKLPTDVEWPTWEGHGPLSFIASLDCSVLPVDAVDIDLPTAGALSFFYFDGQLDDGDALVLAQDRDSWAGARVVYAPAESVCSERDVPEGLRPYPVVPLTARRGMTAAEPWHRQVRKVFAPEAPMGRRYDHPVCSQEFLDALWEFDGEVGHQIGGHAHSVQNPVEIEVAEALLDGEVSWDSPELDEEAGRWLLLAQFDSDDAGGMMWGDCGALYWLIRPQDLTERRFDQAMFTWQCS